MTDPARQLPQDDQPNIRPQLGVIQGGGETSEPTGRGHLHSVPSGGDGSPEPEASDAAKLKALEGGGESTPGRGNLQSVDGPGLYRAETGTSDGGLFNPVDDASPKSLYRRLRLTRRKTIAGGIIGAIVGGSLFGSIMISGPLEALHLTNALLQSFSHSDQESSNRLGKLFRYARFARTGDIGETRVGFIGSKIFGSAIQDLKDIGIEFDRNRLTGRPTKLNIDTEKLKANYPELENMSPDEAKGFLAGKLGVDVEAIQPDSSGSGKYTVDLKGQSIKTIRLVTRSSLRLLGNGRVVTALKNRVLTRYWDTPSLLHPMSKARAAITQAFADKIAANKEKNGEPKAQAEAEASVEAATQSQAIEVDKVTGPVADEAKGAVDNVENARKSLVAKIGRALTLTGVACMAYNTAGDVAKINEDVIAGSSAALALSVAATGEQTKAMNGGMDLKQLGTVLSGFTDSKGGKLEESMPLNSLINPQGKPVGQELPLQYRQGFSSTSTAKSIQMGAAAPLAAIPGGAGFACSTPGTLLQIAVGLSLTVGSEIASGGLDTPGVIAAWSAKTAFSFVGSAVVTAGVIHIIESVAVDNKLPAKVFKGPIGGGLMAYGARHAANVASLSSAAFSLGNTTTTLVDADEQHDEMIQFKSQSMFARLFSLQSTHSLLYQAGDIVDSSGWGSNISRSANSLLSLNSAFGSVLSSFLPHAAAAGTAGTYYWGFPQYGLPYDMLNDPSLDDPYANADEVAKVLDGSSSSDYINKANTCFGVNIVKDSSNLWAVTPDHAVDTSSLDYENAGCTESGAGGISVDETAWRRLTMFIFDSRTMDAAACFQNDDQACSNLGIDAPANTTAAPTGSPVSATGSAADLASQLLDRSNGSNATIALSSFARDDLNTVKQGQLISACAGDAYGHKATSIDANLLQVLVTASSKYKLTIINFDSGHGCDQFLHPRGRATDLAGVAEITGSTSTNFCASSSDPQYAPRGCDSSADNQQLDHNFYTYIASIMPKGSQMGQYTCAGRGDVKQPAGITFFGDFCDHQHLDLGD